MLTCAALILGAHLGTYHFDRAREFEEVNPGIYGQCDEWSAGAYRNSNGKLSVHAGWTFKIGPIDLTLGGVTGYDRAIVLPMIVPSVKIKSVRTSLLLPIEKRGGGLHFSVEW